MSGRHSKKGDMDWILRHFLDKEQSRDMYFTGVAGDPWWNGHTFSKLANESFELANSKNGIHVEPKIYWDFCDSSFNDKLTMNDQDLGDQDNDDPTFSELCIRGGQAMLVCLEMFLAAWAHRTVSLDSCSNFSKIIRS